ncbi:MAG: exo-alpha-sialidase [Deltaproteobacteria bacterium]|nr:exo-alpha-sialidase [Deltaproteobacteria bacterium]
MARARAASCPPLLAAAAALALAACGEGRKRPPPPDPPDPLASPVRASGASPYPGGCNPPVGGARLYLGAEVEPHLAVHPSDDLRLAAAWQQDRWTAGGANGIGAAASTDGGHTWIAASPPLTGCSGGDADSHDRATDPWLSFAADGTLHLVSLVFDDPWKTARQAVVASRSTDGGLTWSTPVALATETSTDAALDKCTLTADPVRAGHVYAVWDRLTGLSGPAAQVAGPTWLARSTDGGATWEAARAIHDPGANAQTISGQIAVLPGGTLVCLIVVITSLDAPRSPASLVVIRSDDAGVTWSAPIAVADLQAAGTVDPATGQAVRDGAIVPQMAVDRASGALHVVWQDARWSGGARDAIALSSSADGGLTWTAPARVSQATAFTPSVAVAASGRLGLSYYDLRTASPAPGLWTVRWLATSADGGATWEEAPVGGPFDLRRAPEAGGYFVGDYQGLVGLADGFVPLFAMSGAATDVFAMPAAAAAMAPARTGEAPPPAALPGPSLAARARMRLEARYRGW